MKTRNLYGFEIKLIHEREAEITCPRSYKSNSAEKFRVCFLNALSDEPTFSIALPWGESFSLAYRWQFSFPARNCGIAKIEKAMTGHFNLYTVSLDRKLADVIYQSTRMMKGL